MKKNAATIALSLFLAAGVLSGCATPKTSEGSSAPAAGNAAETKAEGNTASGSAEAKENPVPAAAPKDGEKKTIHAVTGGNPKPYVYVDENNQPTGYDIEVLKAVFDTIPQYDLDIEVSDFSSVFAGLTAGKYQIGVNNFSYNAERSASYLYSLPYDKVSYVFVFNKDAKPITSLAEAAGLTFEGSAGVSVTNAVEKWNELHPDAKINISYTELDTAGVLQHIVDGQTDFGIIDGPMYVAYVNEYGFDIGKQDIPEEETKLIADNLYAYYLLPKDQTELRDEIDKALIKLKDDGTLKKLSEKYFGGVDQSPEKEKLAGGKTN